MSPRGHLTMSGDILVDHMWRRGATGFLQRPGILLNAPHCTGQPLIEVGYLAQDVTCAELEES